MPWYEGSDIHCDFFPQSGGKKILVNHANPSLNLVVSTNSDEAPSSQDNEAVADNNEVFTKDSSLNEEDSSPEEHSTSLFFREGGVEDCTHDCALQDESVNEESA